MRRMAYVLVEVCLVALLATPALGGYACIVPAPKLVTTVQCGALNGYIYKVYTCHGEYYELCPDPTPYGACVRGYTDINDIYKFCHYESWSTLGPTSESPVLGAWDIFKHYTCVFFNTFC